MISFSGDLDPAVLMPSEANGGGPLLDAGFAQKKPLVVQNLFFTKMLPVLDAPWKASKMTLLHPRFFVRLLPSEVVMKYTA